MEGEPIFRKFLAKRSWQFPLPVACLVSCTLQSDEGVIRFWHYSCIRAECLLGQPEFLAGNEASSKTECALTPW